MIKIIIILLLFMGYSLTGYTVPWNQQYQQLLMGKIGENVPLLSSYPDLEYPNSDYQQILNKFPDKVLLFGYGSLMNPVSASRSMSPEAVSSMKPVVAFGFKRIFNYKASNVSRWGDDIKVNERAMLNIEPTTTYTHEINGVVMEVSQKDLIQLIERETGYDLVPILVADWQDLVSGNPSPHIQVAYTFLVPDELRQGVDYTQTKYYPVRGYLHAVQEGAALYGPEFLNYWNATTYLGDGTTSIDHWDEQTFSGILDTREP